MNETWTLSLSSILFLVVISVTQDMLIHLSEPVCLCDHILGK